MDILKKIKSKDFSVGIVGLGYVGLPLAYAFSNMDIKTVGFDINSDPI
jgi:UDP-N-acetyl-D-glucosamine dehydrogenase